MIGALYTIDNKILTGYWCIRSLDYYFIKQVTNILKGFETSLPTCTHTLGYALFNAKNVKTFMSLHQ